VQACSTIWHFRRDDAAPAAGVSPLPPALPLPDPRRPKDRLVTPPYAARPAASEPRRLAALRALQVLDAAPEPAFELLTSQAALLCGAPTALITLVDADRQWFLSRHGSELRETPREISFCAHTILGEGVFEVPDASADERFAGHPHVIGPQHLRFYAGAPIVLEEGDAVGALCVTDCQARRLDEAQRAQLVNLARLAATLLEERLQRVGLVRELVASEERYRAMVEDQTDLVAVVDAEGRIDYANRALAEIVGETPEALVGRPLLDHVVHTDRGALRGQLRQAREGGAALVGEARMKSLAGVAHWIEWKHRALPAGPGATPAVHSVGRDITERKMLERDLLQSEQRYRGLFDHMQSGFALHEIIRDKEGQVVDILYLAVNAAHARLLGFTPEQMTGARVSELYPDGGGELKLWIETFAHVALEGETINFERYSPRYKCWVSVVAYRPAPLQFATITDDVTDRRAAQDEIQAQHEQLRVTLHSIGDAVIATDNAGRVQYLNPVAERLTGWNDKAAHDRALDEVYRISDENTRAPLPNPVRTCLEEAASELAGDEREATEEASTPLATLTSRRGNEAPIEQTVSRICAADGRVLGAVLVFRDVSDQRRMAREMSYRATHDALTGLVNRSDFEARLNHTLRLAHTEASVHALMYIDLDQFKLVNDACGHAAGDQLLRQVAGLLKQCVRVRDTLARLGGDEFGVILQFCTTEQAQRVAQEICERMDEYRFVYDDRRFRIGTSIGLVPLDNRWPNGASVMQAADAACYAAKEAGRNRVHAWFDADQHLRLRHGEMQWVTRLEQALDENRFVLFAQRIEPIRAETRGLHCEVLLRLRGADGALVPPGAFLPAAERFQMASRIDRWVVRNVVEWMAREREGLGHVDTIAVNLSGQSISDPAFLRQVADVVASAQIDHSKLCFEVTETAAIVNMTDAMRFVETMREHGIRFALDDFGAGASSFGYLKTLKVDYLKIDGQFIRDLLDDPLDLATVRCFRDVAQVIGTRTIAEFVENERIAELLHDIGIDYGQGYLYHRPESLDALLRWRSSRVEEDSEVIDVFGPTQ
jgi:diguanylate cyclase (GGDEF)-like protein/PAS domain S-box-containing protein